MSYIISDPLNLPMLIIQKFLRSFVNRSKFFSPPREQKLSIFIDSSIRDFRIYTIVRAKRKRGRGLLLGGWTLDPKEKRDRSKGRARNLC